MCKASKPTADTATEWQAAYDFFNVELFGGELPNCLITVKAQPRSRGYFAWDRWDNQITAEKTDEISMNSLLFAHQSLDVTLSTLVHEMAHLWHFRIEPETFSKTYHNKAWAAKMETVGLMPTTDGTKEGAKTGRSCTHYIIEGDVFEAASAKLIADGFGLTWAETGIVSTTPTGGAAGGTVTGAGVLPVTASRAKKRASKSKFTCETCGSNAWAKASAKLLCGNHEDGPEPMAIND
jgi:hypothetical protein